MTNCTICPGIKGGPCVGMEDTLHRKGKIIQIIIQILAFCGVWGGMSSSTSITCLYERYALMSQRVR